MGIAGVDGCRGGWVVALHNRTATALHTQPVVAPKIMVLESFVAVLQATSAARIVAVDIPMGFLDAAEAGGRECDRLARQLLGGRRASSVFSPPVRRVLSSRTYMQALRWNRASSPRRLGISKQCFHLLAKMAEVDAQMTPTRQRRIREAHPELSFQSLNGGRALAASKRTHAGRAQRRSLLQAVGFGGGDAEGAAFPGASPDDVLDALALCWTAARVASGEACQLPRRAPRDSRGLAMQIWV